MNNQQPAFPSDDRLVRFTFSDTERAAGLIREFLPAKLVANLDLAQLTRIPEQNINKSLKERRDDLNFECPLIPKGKVSIRILVEHKSAHDPNLWLQLCATILHTWTNSKMAPVIPIVLHTGPKLFRYNSPQYELRWAPQSIREWLPTIPIVAIDLSGNSETRIENSAHLDAVAKVILCIMKLVQSKKASLHKILNIISRHFPNTPSEIQREHLEAAITYIKYKTGMPSDELEQLRSTMALAHPIHPRSVFAMELRAERAKGIAIGIAQAEQKAAQVKDVLNAQADQKAALEKSTTIQNMLAKNYSWNEIADITGVAEADFPALLQKAQSAGKAN